MKSKEPNFWLKLPKGFGTLAPMEDVTDTVFREIVLSTASPEKLHVVFTEFTSTDGLCHEMGFKNVSQRLIANPSELALLKARGIKLVAQIWGNRSERFFQSAHYISALGIFDGIDINMGCPAKKIVKKNCCSALIQFPDLAKEIIAATKEGTDLPVSVKTRLGFKKVITEEWITHLLEADPAAITLHGRIQSQDSEGEADWGEIAKAVALRDQSGKSIPVIGNGDIFHPEQVDEYTDRYGVDGVMVGRGIFRQVDFFAQSPLGLEKKLELMRRHIHLYRDTWADKKDYNVLKRFYKIYVQGFRGASRFRDELYNSSDSNEALEIADRINDTFTGAIFRPQTTHL